MANGGLSKDGKTVTWKLKRGVTWHDGKPFTADDCVFNWEYVKDPATGCRMDKQLQQRGGQEDRLAHSRGHVRETDAVLGRPVSSAPAACMIPKHLFADFIGAKSRDAPTNLKPVGTGPYKFVDFKPGDMVRGEINTNYHVANRPYFDTIEMKGGGDAVSAARAVIQTGEFDYAWNVQVEDEILKRLEVGGKGRAAITPGGNIEFIQLNQADPWTEVDGERANPKSKHPIFSDPAVRQAMALLVDRKGVQDFIYGRTGVATGNFINNPPPFRSPNTKWEFNVDKANAVLEAAGWKKGADGIREKGGKKLKLVFQTSINAPRQKTQAIIKQACQKAGVDLELKSVTASVFFSSDVANPDTYTKFWCDMQMYTTTMTQPDPELFMDQYVSWLMSSRENKWQGRNAVRWKNDEYDKAYRAAEAELDPVKRAALFIRMNDLVCMDNVIIPVVYRPRVAAVSTKLSAPLSGWDNDFWNLKDWYRDTGI